MPLRRLVELSAVEWPRPGLATVIDMAGVSVALFNVGDQFFALSDACIRCGGSLASGSLERESIGCSCCGWRYDLRTGRLPALPGLGVDSFGVEVLGSRLLVAVDPDDQKA